MMYDRYLHLLLIFRARKFIIGLIIRYVSLNIIGTFIILKPRTFVFTVSSTVICFNDIRQDFTHSFCIDISSSWARSSCSEYLHLKSVEFWDFLYSGILRKVIKYSIHL
jgi:hypothetical protein